MTLVLDKQDASPYVVDSSIDLQEVMDFQFTPLLERLQKKSNLSAGEAAEVFEDTKRFLYLCGSVSGGPFVPTPAIDDCWHHFILFTQDYADFCHRFFRKFLHHRPTRSNDPKDGGKRARATLAMARAVFGDLSHNWTTVAADDAENPCDSCGCNAACSTAP